MTRTISIITATVGAALLFAVPAWADNWGADQGNQPTRVSPDRDDHAAAAEQNRLSAMLDAREQSLGAGVGNGKVGMLDAREYSFAAKQNPQLASSYPDWFERAAVASIRDNRVPVVDDRFTIDPTTGPGPVTASSGREIDVPQVGILFGIGIVLLLGLGLAMRAAHVRPFAH